MGSVVTERKYHIHYYEVDYKKRCLVTTLMNYFEDMALIQSEEQGVDIEYLTENKLAWVLYKWDIKIDKYPLYRQNIKVRTRAYSFVKFYAYRQFEIISDEGETIGTASSLWLLINTETKKPIKIDERMYKAYGIGPDENTPLEMKKTGGPSRIDSLREFEVRYTDIDTNKHVNNVKYIDWSIETVPQDVVESYTLKRIVATYKKEAVYGEIIKSLTEINQTGGETLCLHRIEDKEGKELCLLETLWVRE